ncbi:hypothetical protein QQ008_10230 [Fulvivirgaceae bacterium BMA10]|uniref:Uncharacterized protein n=1 Tax=Splendidivirga corallicola TaxID=3051826 RepID=A0ABT8KNF1_9BACT|nr:hypothetical protein [Fulvivirgaceae bacterium BMA10]
MQRGHIRDPKTNSNEKDFGILVVEQLSDGGKCKEIPYVKDKNSRAFTAGTPVVFEVEKIKTDFCKDYNDSEHTCIEIANSVRINEEEIDKHKIVKNLNVYSKVLLNLSDDKLNALSSTPSEIIFEHLNEAVDKIVAQKKKAY